MFRKSLQVMLLTGMLLVSMTACGTNGQQISEAEKETNTDVILMEKDEEKPTAGSQEISVIPDKDASGEVLLRIAIPQKSSEVMEMAAHEFMERYQNCTVELEYISDYQDLLINRLEISKIDKTARTSQIDLVLMEEPLTKKDLRLKYFYNLDRDSYLDFSECNEELVNAARERTGGKLYGAPLGGTVAGLFVNVPMLKERQMEIPVTYQEFLACCEAFSEAGVVPIGVNESYSVDSLFLGDFVKHIHENPENERLVSMLEYKAATVFEEEIRQAAELGANGYIEATSSKTEELFSKYPFVPGYSHLLESEKYQFVLPPSPEGESRQVFMTAATQVCLNKYSVSLDMGKAFINFLMEPEMNQKLCIMEGLVPDESVIDAYVSEKFAAGQSVQIQPVDGFLVTFSNMIHSQEKSIQIDLKETLSKSIREIVSMSESAASQSVQQTEPYGQDTFVSDNEIEEEAGSGSEQSMKNYFDRMGETLYELRKENEERLYEE